MSHGTWMVQRAVIAICLLVGFYLLAIGIALGLLWIPYAAWTYAGRIHIQLLAICVGAGGAILWALVPRPDRFEPPGPPLEKSAHPELFRLIEEVASRTHQPMPANVYLLNEVNAWVTQRGGVMGVGSRRVMGIGLPLLQTLTVPELKAVIAHEFGHYHSGDVALGPWIHKTRGAIARTIAGVHDSWFVGVFVWYGRQFLKVTHAVSRRQEFIADAIAADLCGRDAMASALRRTASLAPMFTHYVSVELMPVLRAGFLPPVASGFEAFLRHDRIAATMGNILSEIEARADADPLDTHPPLRERLNALGAAEDSRNHADVGAISLVRDTDGLALALVKHAFGAEADKLTSISWQQVGDCVYAASWRNTRKHYAAWLSRFTADGLPSGKRAFVNVGSELVHPDEENVNSDARIERATYLFGAAISSLLLDRGWHADTSPGKPVVLVSNGATMEPFAAVRAMAEGTLTEEAWKQQCGALGITGHQLSRLES